MRYRVMKGAVYRIYFRFWFMLFVSRAYTVPVVLSPAVTNETIHKDGNACFYEDERYDEGQHRPSTNPCETCTCQPPEFSCRLKSCDVKLGCKILHSAGHCCPNYICDCEKNGRTYGNGEKVEEPNPCNVCYCRGGEIKCTGLTCYTRKDCEPHYVSGKCCPKYDHCPALNITERPPPVSKPTTTTTTEEPSSTAQTLIDEKNQSIGKLEIIEVYPENQTTNISSERRTTTEPISTSSEFLKNSVTVNETEGLVIITAYSRVSIDSPKFTEKYVINTTETTVRDEISTTSQPAVSFQLETENSTETTPAITETTNFFFDTTLPENQTDFVNTTVVSDSFTEQTTHLNVESVTPKVFGPTLVEILLKWLQSKRKVDPKPAATTSVPDEKPMSFLAVLQTQLLRIANESKPDERNGGRARNLEMENVTVDQSVEISPQEIADLAAALNKSETDRDDPFALSIYGRKFSACFGND